MGRTPMKTRGMTPQARANALNTEGRYSDRILGLEDAYGDFFKWGAKKRADFIASLKVAGILGVEDGEIQAFARWQDMVKQSALYYQAGHKVSPWDVLSGYVKQAGGNGKSNWVRQGDFEVNAITGERRYVGPRFKTQTDTRIDLTDPDTAHAIARKIFQDLMGRDPGQGELGAFAKALSTAEQNAPVVSTTTTEFDMATGEPVGTDTTTSGGMTDAGRALIAEGQIKKDPEYGAFQAVTTYQNALENLVWGAPDLGA